MYILRFAILFVFISVSCCSVEYIHQQDRARCDVYDSSRDAEKAKPFTDNISSQLTNHSNIDYDRSATEAEREVIYKAMMGSVIVHDHTDNLPSLYKRTSQDACFQSHFKALQDVEESIQILWKCVKQKNYIHEPDQVSFIAAREGLLTKHFVKWFYEALESYQPDMKGYITPISAPKGKIISPAVVNAPLRSDIHQIIGVKPLERRDGKVTDVYFVLEKLTQDTIERWKTYVDNAFSPRGKNGGDEGFRESLTYYERTDTWVAYAASKNPKTEELVMGTGVSFDKKSDIEMVFCIHMDERLPVTTHMGIYRPFASQEMVNGDVVMRHDCHKNLSVELPRFRCKSLPADEG